MTTTMIGVEQPRDEQEQPKRLVHYRVEDGVGFIELDNPPANTYTFDVMRKLDDAIVKARFDDDVHVVVLSGRGERFFSAGANIGMMQRVTPRFLYHFSLYANETLNRLEHTPKLTGAELPLGSGQALERELQQQLFQSEDAREGIVAFNEKRMALFAGR